MIRLIAHRGASAEAPENTEAAVRRALAQGADAVECDVQFTADGVPLVLHDPDLVRLGVAGPPVASRHWQELRGTPLHLAGRTGEPSRLLSLAEWLALLPGSVLPVVELKEQQEPARHAALAQACVDVLEARKSDVRVISFCRSLLHEVRTRAPSLVTGPITNQPWTDTRRRELREDARGCLVVKKTVREAAELEWFLAEGHEVWCYPLDEPEEMAQALEEGVTGIITNRPAVARALLDRRAGAGRRP